MSRRSINSRKRRSSLRPINNASGVLDDDTNVYDNEDPRWFENSAVRPSTSIGVSRYESAVLNADSTVETSELPQEWYKKLPRSDSSVAIEELLKNKERAPSARDKTKSPQANPAAATESESDNEPRLKRPKFTQNKKKQLDESNAFLKALEKTTEARTRTIVINPPTDGHESESTNDESKTIKKLRPLALKPKNAAAPPQPTEDTICSDSASEKIQMNFDQLRLRRRSLNPLTSTPEVTGKVQSMIKDKENVALLTRELRNRSIKVAPALNTSKQSDASKVEPPKKKQRHRQGNQIEETASTTNVFAAALDTRDDDTHEATLQDAGDGSKSDTLLVNRENDTENSSIPVNIRRTRSHSMFKAKGSNDDSKADDQSVGNRTTRSKNDQENDDREEAADAKNKSSSASPKQSKSTTGKKTHVDTSKLVDAGSSDEDSIYGGPSKTNTLKDKNTSINASKVVPPKNKFSTVSPKPNKSANKSGKKTNVNTSKLHDADFSDKDSIYDGPSKTNTSNDKNTSINASKVVPSKNKSSTVSPKPNKSANKSGKKTNVDTSQLHDAGFSDEDSIYDGPSNTNTSKDKNTSIDASKIMPTTNKSSMSLYEKYKAGMLHVPSFSSSDEEEEEEEEASKSKTHTKKDDGKSVLSQKASKVSKESKDNEDSSGKEIVVDDQPNDINPSKNISASSSDKENATAADKLRRSQLPKTVQMSSSKIPSNVSKNNVTQNESVESPSATKSRSRLFRRKANEENKRDESELSLRQSPRGKSSISQKPSESVDRTRKTLTFESPNKNKSVTHDSAKLNSQQDETEEGETSTIPKYIRRTKSRLFEQSKNQMDDDLEQISHRDKTADKSKSKSTKQHESQSVDEVPALRRALTRREQEAAKQPRVVLNDISHNSSSHNRSNHSVQKSKRSATVEKSPRGESLDELPIDPANSSPQGESLDERSNDASKSKSNAVNSQKSNESSVETSNDGALEPAKNNQSKANRSIPANKSNNRSVPPNQTSNFDDLLHTPDPAQSTLMPMGKPVNRITDFFAIRKTMNRDTVHEESAKASSKSKEKKSKSKSAQDDDESEVSDYPMLTRQLNDIPYENERTTYQEDEAPPEKSRPSIPQSPPAKMVRAEDLDEKDWAEVFARVKKRQEAITALRMREEKTRLEEERKKASINARAHKELARKLAEKKRAEKAKKPINPAYMLNGKPYKQPKLPRPKKWVTDRLYKHLWKRMEPKYELRTRVKSERFITWFSDIYDHILKKKKYEDYENELEDLLVRMARINLIEDRADFYRFCRDYMPHDFIMKVVPMMLPGNRMNIPFDPKTIYHPIISEEAEE